MMILIPGLQAYTILGIHDWEKQAKREVILNIEISFDGSKAAASDAIEDTLDYHALSNTLVNYLADARFELIEALAEAVLDKIFEHTIVESVVLEVQKPGAIEHAPLVAIKTTRSRT